VRRHLLTLSLVLAAAAPATAQACSCRFGPLVEMMPKLGVIFDGTVDGRPTRLSLGSEPRRVELDAYRFKVHRVWKGDVGPVFRVAYPLPQGANCGVALKDGESLLIGAWYGREPDKPPEANGCTLMNMNQPTLDHVRELGPPLREYRR
jgi:hypothetical protein